MDKTALRKLILKHFSLDELQTLCFDLNIDYGNFEGKSKDGVVRELILYCERFARIPDLLDAIESGRPKLKNTLSKLHSGHLPSEEEIAQICERWVTQFNEYGYPAYLVDRRQKLLTWNKFAPKLLGLNSNSPELENFKNITIFELIFDIANNYVEIVNYESYLPDLIKTIKAQDIEYSEEAWYKPYIRDVLQKYPEFAQIWHNIKINEDDINSIVLGNIVPIKLKMLNQPTEIAAFKLNRVPFANDPRFWTVLWIPIEKSREIWSRWAEKEYGSH